MGWRGFTRQLVAAGRRAERQAAMSRRRSERDAQRHHKEMVRAQKDWAKMEALQRARSEFEFFRSTVDVLLSVHKQCGTPSDWPAVARAPEPRSPAYSSANEDSASAKLRGYRPGFFVRLFGMEAKQRADLEDDVELGRATDRNAHNAAVAQHQSEHEAWLWYSRLSAGILSGDLAAYEEAVGYFEPLEELEEQGCQIQIGTAEPWYIEVNVLARDESIVPSEEKSLLASGKLSTKKMPAAKQRELYQDYICGCALRSGREMLALLPVEFVITHISINMLDKATGHHGPTTVLSVALSRSGAERLNFTNLDPSDAMANFVHRMGFKKSTGFSPTKPLEPGELRRGTAANVSATG